MQGGWVTKVKYESYFSLVDLDLRKHILPARRSLEGAEDLRLARAVRADLRPVAAAARLVHVGGEGSGGGGGGVDVFRAGGRRGKGVEGRAPEKKK